MMKSQEERLRESRRVLRDEIRKAIDCVKPKEKVALVESWKKKYSPVMVDQLVRVAKDRKVRVVVASWDIDEFDVKRKR